MNEDRIGENIARLRQRISVAAEKSQRSADDICLVAVSKTRPPQAVRTACRAGLTHFGENYLQEALPKIEALRDLPLTWHYIGPIQSNKTRDIAAHFDWVHSVARGKIARRLCEQRPDALKPLQVCVQVNISGEPSKAGVAPDELRELLEEIQALPRLCLRGLMAIPAATTDPAEQRRPFAALRNLLEEMQAVVPQMDTLSMGMSGDLEAAIAEGATLVRVGTDIFGPRER